MTERRSGGYPWLRKRLAPVALREVLLVSLPSEIASAVPDSPPMLADLDARAWDWFSRDQCERLADLIAATVRTNIGELVQPGQLALRRPPKLSYPVALADLDLSVRVHNALERSVYRDAPDLLGAATLEDLLGVKGFGAKGIVELLVALEEAGAIDQPDLEASQPRPAAEIDESPDPDAFLGGLTEQDVATLGAWCRGELDTLPQSVLRKRLPALPESTHVDDLSLLARTAGAITRRGHAQLGTWLRDACIRDILQLPNFGRSSMRDLLDAIVRLMLQPPPSEELTALAAAIAATPDADAYRGDDPRFGLAAGAICRPGESILAAARRIEGRTRDPVDVPAFMAQLRAILTTLQRLDSQLLEDELLELAATVSNERSGEMFARYFGWDGEGGTTLSAVGDEFGLTRERIRQLCRKVETQLRTNRPHAPVLCRALSRLTVATPLWADEAVQLLRDQRIAHGNLEPRVLIEAGEMLDLNVPIRVVPVAGRDRVTLLNDDSTSELDQTIRLIRRIGRRTVEHWGVGRVRDVTVAASGELGSPVDEQLVLNVLMREEGLRWLHQDRGWFWNTRVSRNRLTNQMDKVLCVAKALPVSELRLAVARNYRMEGQAPPLDILTEFCRQLPNRVVEDDVVRVDPPLDPAEILADTELLFYETLAANGAVMSRADLEDACRARGMNRVTFYIYLGNSPILVCPRRGVYALIGADIPPHRIEELAVQHRRGRVLVGSGRLDDDQLWIIYRLSENMLVAGVCSVPTVFKPELQGEFEFRTDAGDEVGTIRINDNSAWGLRPYLRQSRAGTGQFLALTFDLNTRTVSGQLGGDELHPIFAGRSAQVVTEDDDDDDDDDEADELPDSLAPV